MWATSLITIDQFLMQKYEINNGTIWIIKRKRKLWLHFFVKLSKAICGWLRFKIIIRF